MPDACYTSGMECFNFWLLFKGYLPRSIGLKAGLPTGRFDSLGFFSSSESELGLDGSRSLFLVPFGRPLPRFRGTSVSEISTDGSESLKLLSTDGSAFGC